MNIEAPEPTIDPPGIPRPDQVDSPSPGALDESAGDSDASDSPPGLLGTAEVMTTEPHDPLEPDLPDPAPEREDMDTDEPTAKPPGLPQEERMDQPSPEDQPSGGDDDNDGAATDVSTEESSG